MAKQLRTVPVMLDRDRNLGYTFASCRAIKKETGVNPFTVEFWDGVDFERMIVLMWAGLLHEDKDLKLDQVAEIMVVDDMASYMSVILEAWQKNNPEPKTDKDSPQTPAA